MSIRRPSKEQPETFEFNSASLEAALNSKVSGCSFEGLLMLIYLSTSPNTMSNEPNTAGTSASMWPLIK